MENNRSSLDKIAEYLLEKENITGEEFMRLLDSGNSTELQQI